MRRRPTLRRGFNELRAGRGVPDREVLPVTTVSIAPAERQDPAPSPEQLAAALRALREDGFVVLEGAAEREHLARLRERMLEDLDTILARPDAPYNFNRGNVQQDPPPLPQFLYRDVLLNELVISVTHALLGDGLQNSYYSGNTALPDGSPQPVHPDLGQLWPDLEQATPPFGFVINVPVVDVSPANGSTELWPGTHRDATVFLSKNHLRVPEKTLERRRALVPPVQPTIPCGGVLIRDLRLWHRGMPNRTATPRPMIAMIHWISWWRPEPVTFPKGTEPFFDHPVLRTNARFVEGPIDYLSRNEAYDFDGAEE